MSGFDSNPFADPFASNPFAGEKLKSISGIDLVLNKHTSDTLLVYEYINERFLTAKFQTSIKDLNVICCYVPTEDVNEDEKDRFYGQLQDILNSVKKGDITLVLGDFNAKVGTDSDLWGGVIGPFVIGSCDGNGQHLLQDPAVTRVTNQTNMSQPGLDDYNPFADQQKTQPTQQKVGGSNVPQYNAPPVKQEAPQPAVMQPIAEPPPAYSPTAAQPITSAELQRKQEELERKAAELQAKEDALRQGTYDARANNWPPLPKSFCIGPCFYQDIAVDIPLEFQKLVKTMYYLWMFYVCVLFLNVLGGAALMFAKEGGTIFGFSILAFLLFTPLSFVCWFRPLYKAFRSDSSFNFMVFFFIFFFQFVLAVIYAIGIPGVGSCGFIVGISAMGNDQKAVGALVLILAALHSIFAAASFFMLVKIHRMYRSTGASFAKAQEEFTSGVLRNEHVQTAAATAVAGAARQTLNQSFSGNP